MHTSNRRTSHIVRIQSAYDHSHRHLPVASWTEAFWPLSLQPVIALRTFRRERTLTLRQLSGLLTCLLLLLSFSVEAAVREVGPIGLTVNNLEGETKFFTEVLQFKKLTDTAASYGDVVQLSGIPEANTKSVTLALGDEQITLTEWTSPKGRAIPADSRSFDHWFQHIAIVVSDMDQAYAHLLKHKVRHVSTFPQTLPSWNQGAAGIRAFYFQDPEGHVLEVIWFPIGKGNPKWQKQSDRLFLGIDHTAIVVSDTDRSLTFYRDTLGMKVAGASENYGTEQEHLNQVFGARLRITALRAEKGPGIEFLEYITPPGGRPLPEGSKPNDLIFWHTHLMLDEQPLTANALSDNGASVITPESKMKNRTSRRDLLVRDPDGHGLWLQRQTGTQAAR